MMSNEDQAPSAPAASDESETWVDDNGDVADDTPAATERPRKTPAPANRHARRNIERYWEERALRARIVDDVDAA